MRIDSIEKMPINEAVDTKEYLHEFSVVSKARIYNATSVSGRKVMVIVVRFGLEESTRRTVNVIAAQQSQNFGRRWTDRANATMPCAQREAALVIDGEHT